MARVLQGVIVFFNLALPFMDNIYEMGSHTSVELDCWMDSKLSEVDL